MTKKRKGKSKVSDAENQKRTDKLKATALNYGIPEDVFNSSLSVKNQWYTKKTCKLVAASRRIAVGNKYDKNGNEVEARRYFGRKHRLDLDAKYIKNMRSNTTTLVA